MTDQLSRRRLVVGAAAGGSLLSACFNDGAPSQTPNASSLLLSPEEVEREWARLTKPRAALVSGTPLPLDRVLSDGRSKGRKSNADEVALSAVRTLFLSGAFRDLPETARVHPTVQATMRSAMPEFDSAIIGMKQRLDALSPTERADLAREFKRDPQLGERVLAIVDEAAADKDVSDVRRLHLRRMGLWVCERLAQSSEMLVGEYSRKMEKVFERGGTEAESERRLMASLGAASFAAMKSRIAEAEERYRVAGAMRTSDPEYKRATGESDNSALLTAGGIFMGLAGVSGIIGAVIVATGGIAGAFVLTAGAVFLLVGLILLIVAAAVG